MNRTISIALILILITSCLSLVSLAFAKPHSALYAPQFTVTYVDKSYDVEPVYKVDQYTGQTVVKTAGYHAQNASVYLNIKNPPFTPYTINGSQANLYYKIGVKGHYGAYWQEYTYYYATSGEYSTKSYYRPMDNEANTLIVFGFNSNNGSAHFNGYNLDAVAGGEVDFRIQCYTAYKTMVKNEPIMAPGWQEYSWVFTVDDTSGWSNTQTVQIGSSKVVSQSTPAPAIQPTPSLTTEPTQTQTEPPTQQNTQTSILPEFTWKDAALAAACIAIVCLAVALVLSRRKNP